MFDKDKRVSDLTAGELQEVIQSAMDESLSGFHELLHDGVVLKVEEIRKFAAKSDMRSGPTPGGIVRGF